MELFERPCMEITAYTAGFFDGEGSIWFTDNRFSCGVSQAATNDGETLMRWFQEQWGFGNISCQRKRWGNRDWEQWHWSVNAARAVEHLLTCCLPYLRVKRDAALAALEHCRRRAGQRNRWAPGETGYLQEHWQEEDAAIARALGRTAVSVRHRRKTLRLPNKPGGGLAAKWTPTADAYLRGHLHWSNPAIAAALGTTTAAVRGRLRRLGLVREAAIRKQLQLLGLRHGGGRILHHRG